MSKRKAPEADAPPLSCELLTASGLGDRLLDVWAALTIARLHRRPLALSIKVGLTYQGFTGDYDWGSIRLPDCTVVPAAGSPAGFSFAPCTFYGVEGDRLTLRHARRWATTTLRELVADKAAYGVDGASDEEVRAAYVAVVTGTRLASEQALPKGAYVGYHVRRKDKIAERSIHFHDMSPADFASVEARALDFAAELVARGQRKIFLCGDDPAYNATLAPRLRAKGAEVLVSDYSAEADHHCLSCCSLVVQVTLYSTFSITAAMIGRVPLVNFCEAHKTMLGEWLADGVLARAASGPDVPNPRAEHGLPAAWLDMDGKTAAARRFLEALSAACRGDRERVGDFVQAHYAEDVVLEGASDFVCWRVDGRQTCEKNLREHLGDWKYHRTRVTQLVVAPQRSSEPTFEFIGTVELELSAAAGPGGRARVHPATTLYRMCAASRRVVYQREFAHA
jgi:hypothetical protein